MRFRLHFITSDCTAYSIHTHTRDQPRLSSTSSFFLFGFVCLFARNVSIICNPGNDRCYRITIFSLWNYVKDEEEEESVAVLKIG